MLLSSLSLVLSLCSLAAARFAVTPISQLRKGNAPELAKRDVDPADLYPEYNISVPIDYFHNESKYEPHSDGKFNLRYFFDASHYKPGGPVIVLQGGETSVTDRLPYLQKGIVAQLAKATNGIGVILEHRYYGTSFPTPDLSTKNLRFLTTQQALADMAYFAQNVKFKGLEQHDLTSKTTPYIAYGGSYAGGFVAFLRTTYPDVYFGSIASSGVTEAVWDFWRYYSPIAEYGDTVVPQCVEYTQKLTNIVDNILIGKNQTALTKRLKTAFGLQDIVHDDDFANVLSFGIGGWQGRNWDPAVNDPSFFQYCSNITTNATLYPATTALSKEANYLINAGGYGAQAAALVPHMLNYIGYINLTIIAPVAGSGETLDSYYTNYNSSFYALDSLDAGSWRSWPYQYCTQWGYLQTGSGVPKNQLPLISRTLTLEYESIICREAFGLYGPANTSIINAYGGYNIAYDRLAFVDGEVDPWRGVTPHSPLAKPRTSTTDRPWLLIAGAVHHWDENGLFPNETTPTLPPKPVADTQSQEATFVKAWLKEWKQPYPSLEME